MTDEHFAPAARLWDQRNADAEAHNLLVHRVAALEHFLCLPVGSVADDHEAEAALVKLAGLVQTRIAEAAERAEETKPSPPDPRLQIGARWQHHQYGGGTVTMTWGPSPGGPITEVYILFDPEHDGEHKTARGFYPDWVLANCVYGEPVATAAAAPGVIVAPTSIARLLPRIGSRWWHHEHGYGSVTQVWKDIDHIWWVHVTFRHAHGAGVVPYRVIDVLDELVPVSASDLPPYADLERQVPEPMCDRLYKTWWYMEHADMKLYGDPMEDGLLVHAWHAAFQAGRDAS